MLKPAFLYGTFLEAGLGFQLASIPPFDLSDPGKLQDDNPFVALAVVLEQVKRGRFQSLSRLIDLLKKSASMELWDNCAALLGHAGPTSKLRDFLAAFHKQLNEERHLGIQKYACEILSRSMQLWTVPIMLEMYLKAEDRSKAELLPMWISMLLEEEPGPVYFASLPNHEYQALVTKKYDTLCDKLGSPSVPVLRGQLFSVHGTAQRLLARLSSPEEDSEEIPTDRMFFESSTGIDCRGFFDKNSNLRPLAAAGIVETFLHSPDAARYDIGVRYFFGHRIPD